MVMLRGEEVGDYNFELWVEYFIEQGYPFVNILEMIEYGKRMKKFGTNRLAIGDLISEWENNLDAAELGGFELKRKIRFKKRYAELKN